MVQKAHKTMGHVTPQRPMTDEEKQARIMQFLQQRRESFSINILCSLLQMQQRIMQVLMQKRETFSLSILPGMVQGAVTNKDVTNIQCKSLIDLAVEMADELLEKLYPMPKEDKE